MRWWWVRHAPTHARAAIGWTDIAPDLGDTGGLERLARALPQAPVVSSDLARARLTADRLAQGRPRLADEPGFREINFGAWEGLAFDAIADLHPADYAAFWANPGPARATGGEGFDDLAARVGAAIDRLNRAEGEIVAVAHAGAIHAALARAAGLSARQALAFRLDPLSVTRLDWLAGAQAWRVEAVNRRF